jgi:hypothetical protein
MTTDQPTPMTVETVRELLETAGAKVAARSGRSDSYGAPREFSFEVRAVWPNGLGLHVVARQFSYRDPWETEGRVNDMVDVAFLRDGGHACLPKGFEWFQGRDEETGVELEQLRRIVAVVAGLNPKIFRLQELTGDLS